MLSIAAYDLLAQAGSLATHQDSNGPEAERIAANEDSGDVFPGADIVAELCTKRHCRCS
jgi:hypothetical protein